jgi:hypothetical protein
MFSDRLEDLSTAWGPVSAEDAFLQALDILCVDESLGARDAFDSYFKGFKSHYDASGDIDVDRDVFEYICDAISSEGARSLAAVTSILAPFYPALTLRPPDVPGLVRAAEVLKISKEKGNVPLYSVDGPKRLKGLAALRSANASSTSSAPLPAPPALVPAAVGGKAVDGDQEGEDGMQSDEDGAEVNCLSEAAAMDLSEIGSMFPNVPQDILEHVFIHYCAKNKEPTVLFLLDNCTSDESIEKVRKKIEAARLRELREEEQRAAQLKAAQAAAVDRFGDQVVVRGDGKKRQGKGSRGDGAIAAALRDQRDSKVLFQFLHDDDVLEI